MTTTATATKTAKKNRFRLAKQYLCSWITLIFFFFTFLSRRCTACYMKLPRLMPSVCKVAEQSKKFSLSFSKLRYRRFEYKSGKFRQHLTNYMKLNKIEWIRFETAVNSCFRLVVIQKFCYHGNVT